MAPKGESGARLGRAAALVTNAAAGVELFDERAVGLDNLVPLDAHFWCEQAAFHSEIMRQKGEVLFFWDCYRPHDVQVSTSASGSVGVPARSGAWKALRRGSVARRSF